MNIYLSNTTNFSNNGLGFLTDIISANVIDELNGNYELQLVYIRDGKLSEYLVEENIIKCKVSDSTYQLFRITNVEKTFKTITIIAKHIFYDLLNNFLENTYPQNLSCQLFLQHILDHTNFSNSFTAVSDISTTKTARYVRMNPVSAIIGDNNNSMVNLFGGELKRDNFTINFLSRVGSNNGVKLLIGKNITGINISIDITSMATRIMPQGFDGLLLPELYVDSPLINNYPTPKIVKIEFSDVVYDPNVENAYHDIQDAYAELRRRAEEQYSLGIDKPKINIKIDWIELSKTEEYKSYQNLERVNLGDTITAYILGINYETRVISTNYDVLKDMIVDFEIGTVKPSITSSMSKIQKSVEEINPDSILKTAKDEATELITTAMGGYVYKTESELYIMNTNDPTTATKVWRWNINGLGYSSTGINGSYGIAMTMDGAIVADYITTGTLNTSVIQGYDSIVTTVSGISTTYETKTDATSKLNTAKTYAESQAGTAETNAKGYAKDYTDGQLENYSTTTEMNSAITQKADQITQSVSATYITKNDSASNIATAKSEAINSANSSTDSKLENYTDTTGMNNAIKGAIETITDTIDETEVGNPLYIENAQNEKPIEFELYGDTLQDGTPTPDNPINIDVVTGRQEISVVGKNLLKSSLEILKINNSNGVWNDNVYTLNGVSFTVNNDLSITVTGTASANAQFYISKNTSHITLGTGTYYITSHETTGSNSSWKMQFGAGGGAINIYGTGNNKEATVTLTENTDITGYIYVYSGKNPNGAIFYPMIAKTSGVDYEPYNGNTYEINLGKNLFKPISFSRSSGGINYVYGLDGSISCDGTATTNSYSMLSTDAPNYMFQINQGTYRISGASTSARLQVIKYDNGSVSALANTTSSTSFTVDSPTNIYIRIQIPNGTTVNNVKVYPQLEKGSVATSYSAYKEPIELCEINDYQDKIFKRDNRWYLRKEIGKVVLDGSETYTSMGWSSPKFGCRISVNNLKITTNGNIKGYIKSNNFTNYTANELYALTGTSYGIANRNNQSEIVIRNDDISNTSGFKTWLSTHNTIVYYVLAEPTEEPIIDEELINQLDAFELETGINNITNTSFDLAGDMYLKYYLQTPLSDTYVNQVELKSELKITSNEITSMVSETYATKDDTTSTSNPNSLSSRISQTAKSISLSINNGSTTSGIVITTTKEDGTTEQASGTIEMTGLVKFTDLSTSNPTTTIINGDNITTGTIKSSNYVANTSGTKIDLSNGTIDTKDFKVSSTGNITSTGGTIGGWEIQSYGLTKSFGTNGRYVFEIRTDKASNIACLGVWDNNTSSSNFYLTPEGYLYARNGSIGGGMITETITGASINLYNNPGFLKMSLGDTNHPFVSALNVALGSGGISFRNSGNRDNVGGEIGRIYGSSAGNVVIEGDTGTWIQDINIQTNYIMNCYQLSGLQDAYIRQNYSIVLKPNPNGGAYIWGTESYNAILTVGGSPSTLSIKTNVEKKDTSDIPNMLKQIELYDYKYIDEINNGENDYGYIIDYLEKIEGINKYFVFNEIERNGLKYKTINHEHLSKFLLGAVIELQKEINSLKEEK